jgi:hypothetical protein
MVAAPDRRNAILHALGYLQAVRYPQTNVWRFLMKSCSRRWH